MASVLTNILSGGALTGVSKIIDSIRGKSPADAAKLAEINAQLTEMQMKYASDFQLAQMDENVKLNETAGENIRSEQNNLYSSCARPTVIYAWIAIILYNYIITGLIGKQPIQMPDLFWEISGIVITGYVFARSGDKLFGGSGGSAELGKFKLNSKGD